MDWNATIDPGTVPYYPNQTYVDKNWQPERYPIASLQALAQAHKRADLNDLLGPSTTQNVLANALVEGPKRRDYGLNTLYDKYNNFDMDLLKKMGVPLSTNPRKERMRSFAEIRNYNSPDKSKWDMQLMPSLLDTPTKEEQRRNAMMAMYVLADKNKKFGDKMAIERWNGQGKGAKNHVRKVRDTKAMLDDPRNRIIKELYDKYYKEYQEERIR